MANVSAKVATAKSMLAHGLTVDGRAVLLHAQGEVPLHQKLRARWNLRRWNKGKRTWLL